MGATLQPSLLSQLMRHLPRSLLNVLDAWSRRVARRRWERRQQLWLRRKDAAQAGSR